jgi:hypothetical protein
MAQNDRFDSPQTQGMLIPCGEEQQQQQQQQQQHRKAAYFV